MLIKSTMSVFHFMFYSFSVFPKISLPNQGHDDFLLCSSSSRNFIVLGFIFMSINFYIKCKVHCFLDGWTFVPIFFVVKALFLHWFTLSSVENQLLKIICMGLFLDSSLISMSAPMPIPYYLFFF